ncbi:MAG TPA: peptidase E [Gaiellaceae bacterium]|nr:peptidase E [Gaiellaceae bacterium]
MAGHIVAMGGLSEPVLRFALALTERDRPRVALLPTAGGDGDWGIMRVYELLSAHADIEAVRLFGVPDRPRDRLDAADAVVVPGGNTANMLAVWRVHGIDEALEAAWRRGAVLVGWSAGANCWFESSVTDSYGPGLDPLHDGLGFLSGSFCPHYDSEELRRPVYRELVDAGFPSGYAADDGAAFHFATTELREVVCSQPDAKGFRVEPGGETSIAGRPVT